MDKGIFNREKFYSWIKTAEKLAKDNKVEDLYSMFLGRNLVNTPKDDVLWINKTVAKFLNSSKANKIRDCYFTQCYNNIGIYDASKEKELFESLKEEYLQKANELKKIECYMFAQEMKEFAEGLVLDK